MSRFLFWLTGFLPCRIISEDWRPYLERYYIGTLFGWRFYIHRFVGSDPARGLHDHPWRKAYSVILSGSYYEETRSGYRLVRWFNSLTGDTFHRVVLPVVVQGDVVANRYYRTRVDVPCWTLFAHTVGGEKKWGFLRPIESVATWQYKTGTPESGTQMFTPHKYEKEGDQTNWWLRAPTGKEARAAVIHRKAGDA